jgi:hypothetical protein
VLPKITGPAGVMYNSTRPATRLDGCITRQSVNVYAPSVTVFA